MADEGWIGVDLDGTLAFYDEWRGWGHVGEPIPLMAERVKRWLAEGREVRIVTARASAVTKTDRPVDGAIAAVEAWTEKHFGQRLRVTCEKDFGMVELWDDRAVQVETNTGRRIAVAPWLTRK